VAATAELLDEILHPAPGNNELIVDARALQLAGWHHDLYIKVDTDRLLNSEELPTVSTLVAARRLAVYRQPYRTLLVALTVAATASRTSPRSHWPTLPPTAHPSRSAQPLSPWTGNWPSPFGRLGCYGGSQAPRPPISYSLSPRRRWPEH
jgi:hypothetical protein